MADLSIKEMLEIGTRRLSAIGLENARLEAEVLLSHLLGRSRVELYLNFDEKPGKEIELAYEDFLLRKEKREPFAYILGKAYFREIELKITPSVMKPRPETELLVDEALRLIRKNPCIKKVLDIGTGSGAIILSIAFETKGLDLFATDISSSALELAKENAKRLGLFENIRFFCGDLFEPFEKGEDYFDLIISNPPYVPTDLFPELMPEVRDYEPRIALDGGKRGLSVISRILKDSKNFLSLPGWLVLEIGFDQKKEVETLISSEGYSSFEFKKDYQDVDRIAIISLDKDSPDLACEEESVNV